MRLAFRILLVLILIGVAGTVASLQQAPEHAPWLQIVVETLESWFTQAGIDSRNARAVIGGACGAFSACVLTGILWRFKRLFCLLLFVGLGTLVGFLAGPLNYADWLAAELGIRETIPTRASGGSCGLVLFAILDVVGLFSWLFGGEKKAVIDTSTESIAAQRIRVKSKVLGKVQEFSDQLAGCSLDACLQMCSEQGLNPLQAVAMWRKIIDELMASGKLKPRDSMDGFLLHKPPAFPSPTAAAEICQEIIRATQSGKSSSQLEALIKLKQLGAVSRNGRTSKQAHQGSNQVCPEKRLAFAQGWPPSPCLGTIVLSVRASSRLHNSGLLHAKKPAKPRPKDSR